MLDAGLTQSVSPKFRFTRWLARNGARLRHPARHGRYNHPVNAQVVLHIFDLSLLKRSRSTFSFRRGVEANGHAWMSEWAFHACVGRLMGGQNALDTDFNGNE